MRAVGINMLLCASSLAKKELSCNPELAEWGDQTHCPYMLTYHRFFSQRSADGLEVIQSGGARRLRQQYAL